MQPSARQAYRKLDEGPKRDAAELMQDLEENPDDVPAIQLRANPGVWRARFHRTYRMIYQISKAEKRIIVMRIKPRETAYKGMKY